MDGKKAMETASDLLPGVFFVGRVGAAIVSAVLSQRKNKIAGTGLLQLLGEFLDVEGFNPFVPIRPFSQVMNKDAKFCCFEPCLSFLAGRQLLILGQQTACQKGNAAKRSNLFLESKHSKQSSKNSISADPRLLDLNNRLGPLAQVPFSLLNVGGDNISSRNNGGIDGKVEISLPFSTGRDGELSGL